MTLLDQMFTADNFRRIFDSENRKGSNLGKRFFPSLEPHTKAILDKKYEIKAHRSLIGTLTQQVFSAKLEALRTELKVLKSAKSQQITTELELVSLKARKPSYKIALTQKIGPKGKPVFCIDGSPETFFVIKQLQYNIRKIYGLKQSNRHELASQLRNTVATSFPLEVVRTDVSSFYESIDRHRLLERLEEDQLLSSSSKKYIKQILSSYGNVTGTANGIPRGVGISAYLAEFYMRPIDREIRAIRGIILYCRYVDDIAAIFARPHEGEVISSYETAVATIISNHGLSHNAQKTTSFTLGETQQNEFEYLGYHFLLDHGQCHLQLSQSKIKKFENRINAAFDEYERQSSVNSRRAYRELVSRIKFLTGNTRLVNSKSTAVTGTYYNNPMVTDTSSFNVLDTLLKKRINAVKRPNLRKRLKKYKFGEGFLQRQFHNFSAQEFQRIVRAWKHV